MSLETSLQHIEAAIEARCKRLAEDVDADVDTVAEEVERLLDLHGKATEADTAANRGMSAAALAADHAAAMAVATGTATAVSVAPTESTRPAASTHPDA